jgi:hypothetical protein
MSEVAAQIGFEILKSGISAMASGDVEYTGPTSAIGVTATNIPSNVRLKAKTSSLLIFSFHSENPSTGIEHVNVKLNCWIQYDGPQVQATFQFPADGQRSRLMNDTKIRIENPLSLEQMDADENWQRIGIQRFPVVRIPVTVFVDAPWPNDNYHESFMLVLSGMYGFGAPGLEVFENYQQYTD